MTRTLALLACAIAGCTLPGKPAPPGAEGRPTAVADFATLYRENCAGCHGKEGRDGAALALANPVYLAIADDATLTAVTSRGVAGTAMPAFAVEAGGTLTKEQVADLVRGLRAWARPETLRGTTPPPWAGPRGDRQRGADAYARACARCHGADGRGAAGSGSIVDGSFLALVSDQGLRTTLIAGRPELGHPDWRGDRPGQPLSSDDVSDLVAWLAAQRPEHPGQPYP